MPTEKNLEPGNSWEFDDEVASAFDDMLERSIPQYDVMRDLCYRLGRNFVGVGRDVVDLGCSRGGAIQRFLDNHYDARFIGLEASMPMVTAARERFRAQPNVEIVHHDLRGGIPRSERLTPSLILSVLTLQFTPIEYRQRLLRNVHDVLLPGGAFLFVEKVLGEGSFMDDLLVATYYSIKLDNGYSQEQIERKRLSLEGVLVPVAAGWNEEMLHRAGFSEVDCFWRCLNFAGWLAIKE